MLLLSVDNLISQLMTGMFACTLGLTVVCVCVAVWCRVVSVRGCPPRQMILYVPNLTLINSCHISPIGWLFESEQH